MAREFAHLKARLEGCDLRAAHALGRDIRRLEREGRDPPERLLRAVERAEHRLSERAAGRPDAVINQALPIAGMANQIVEHIRTHQVTIVCGETGSGKSTQLPLLCLKAGRGVRGMIGHTQPRRIAARTVAARVAEELHTPLGREVGFKVRFDDATHPGTFVKLMTDGVLLAEMQSDRQLRRYDTIIVDEAHERSLNIDFLLGCLRQMLPKRPELRVIITSATIDPAQFSRHFGSAPVVEVSGRTYPVEVRYRESPETEPAEADQSQQIVDAVAELSQEGPGDVLVFLPGEREIREAAEALSHAADPAVRSSEVMPLYARLASKDQLRAFQPHGGRRVILATNIAETSVTVPGVHYVVDTGLARLSRYHPRTRVQGLDVEPVSRASADQRAGRCGRVADGVCIRLYPEEEYAQRPEFTDPEILRSALAGVVLRMKALRLGDARSFPFVDRPSPRRVREAHETLLELGALDAEGCLTRLGKELAMLPIDPRLGRMLIAAVEEGALREVLIIVAALATRDPRERPMDAREAADRAHEPFVDEASDFLTLLRIWETAREQKNTLSGRGFRKWCAQAFLSWKGLREWGDMHKQLRRVVRDRGMDRNSTPASPDAVHRAVLTGLLSNVGKRGDRHEYEGTLGTEFFLHPGSVLFDRKPRWVMAAEIARTGRVYARMVAPVRPEWIATLGEHLLERTHSSPSWDHRAAAPTVIERVSLLGLPLPAKRRIAYGRVNPVHARELFIRQGLVDGAFRPAAEFVEHNDRMISEVRRLEAKARRRDHEAESGARFDFFDRVIASHVWSGKRFDRWRHKAEAKQPGLLCMQPEDLIVWAENAPTAGAFPDSVDIAGRTHEVEYRHEPDVPEDGVAVRLSLAAFHELTEARHDWLVPGLVRERAMAMLRGLSKPLRKSIGPVPQVVEAFLADTPDPDAPLAETLAAFIGRTLGVQVSALDIRAGEVPKHLVPRVVVVDTSGAVIEEGRDLLELRRRVAGEVEDVLQRGSSPIEPREGVRDWDIDEMPERVAVSTQGGDVEAFPAYVDCQECVALRLLPSQSAADLAHRHGVRRLMVLANRRVLRRTLKGWPGMGAMRLAHAALGLEASLDDELSLVAVERAAGCDLARVRTRAEFEQLDDRMEQTLDASLLETLEVAAAILAASRNVLAAMEQADRPVFRDAVEDVRAQLARLLPAQFLSARSWDRIRHLPRYLRAAASRLQRLSVHGPERDHQRLRELSPRWARWVEVDGIARQISPASPLCTTLDEYRWMLEEFRVSLFAQELGTARKVSAARLDEHWNLVKRALREDPEAASLLAVIAAG